MLSEVADDLRRALEHRHSLTKPRPVLEDLHRQLKTSFTQGGLQVQQRGICLQILLDIDHTLLYTRDLEDVFFKNKCHHGGLLDPDMQRFYNSAGSFWQWLQEAQAAKVYSGSWPMWLPSAEVDGRRYTMWFPDNGYSSRYPVPELVTPVFDSQGTLTHYIMLFALVNFTMSGYVNANAYIAVVPAEFTLLAHLRYELGQEVDNIRRPGLESASAHDTGDSDLVMSGCTEVELYLATAACEPYLTAIWRLLEQLLSCQHGGTVFAGKVSFRNQVNASGSHSGVKTSRAFSLRAENDDVICCRIAVDDHIWWWSDKEEPGKCRLMQIMGWNGRFAKLDRDQAYGIRYDKQKIDFVTPLEGPDVLETPVAPEGLRRLLPEVLQLVCQAVEHAAPKLPSPVLTTRQPPTIPTPTAAMAAANTESSAQQAVQKFLGFAAYKATMLLLYGRQLLKMAAEWAATSAGRAPAAAEVRSKLLLLPMRKKATEPQLKGLLQVAVLAAAVGVAALISCSTIGDASVPSCSISSSKASSCKDGKSAMDAESDTLTSAAATLAAADHKVQDVAANGMVAGAESVTAVAAVVVVIIVLDAGGVVVKLIVGDHHASHTAGSFPPPHAADVPWQAAAAAAVTAAEHREAVEKCMKDVGASSQCADRKSAAGQGAVSRHVETSAVAEYADQLNQLTVPAVAASGPDSRSSCTPSKRRRGDCVNPDVVAAPKSRWPERFNLLVPLGALAAAVGARLWRPVKQRKLSHEIQTPV